MSWTFYTKSVFLPCSQKLQIKCHWPITITDPSLRVYSRFVPKVPGIGSRSTLHHHNKALTEEVGTEILNFSFLWFLMSGVRRTNLRSTTTTTRIKCLLKKQWLRSWTFHIKGAFPAGTQLSQGRLQIRHIPVQDLQLLKKRLLRSWTVSYEGHIPVWRPTFLRQTPDPTTITVTVFVEYTQDVLQPQPG